MTYKAITVTEKGQRIYTTSKVSQSKANETAIKYAQGIHELTGEKMTVFQIANGVRTKIA